MSHIEESATPFNHTFSLYVLPQTEHLKSIIEVDNNNVTIDMKETKEKPLATIEVLNRIKELDERMNQMKADQDVSDDEREEYFSLYNEKCTLFNEYNWFDQAFVENGRYGVKAIMGKVIIPAQFDDYVELFHYDFRRSAIPMVIGGKTVLVKSDGSGEIIPNTEYDTIHYASYTPYYRMWKNSKFGFMSANGTVYVDCICDEYYEPLNGISVYRSGNKWGLIDMGGNVVAPIFDEIIDPEPDECVKVRIGEEVGFVDENGKFTTDEDESYWGFFCD